MVSEASLPSGSQPRVEARAVESAAAARRHQRWLRSAEAVYSSAETDFDASRILWLMARNDFELDDPLEFSRRALSELGSFDVAQSNGTAAQVKARVLVALAEFMQGWIDAEQFEAEKLAAAKPPEPQPLAAKDLLRKLSSGFTEVQLSEIISALPEINAITAEPGSDSFTIEQALTDIPKSTPLEFPIKLAGVFATLKQDSIGETVQIAKLCDVDALVAAILDLKHEGQNIFEKLSFDDDDGLDIESFGGDRALSGSRAAAAPIFKLWETEKSLTSGGSTTSRDDEDSLRLITATEIEAEVSGRVEEATKDGLLSKRENPNPRLAAVAHRVLSGELKSPGSATKSLDLRLARDLGETFATIASDFYAGTLDEQASLSRGHNPNHDETLVAVSHVFVDRLLGHINGSVAGVISHLLENPLDGSTYLPMIRKLANGAKQHATKNDSNHLSQQEVNQLYEFLGLNTDLQPFLNIRPASEIGINLTYIATRLVSELERRDVRRIEDTLNRVLPVDEGGNDAALYRIFVQGDITTDAPIVKAIVEEYLPSPENGSSRWSDLVNNIGKNMALVRFDQGAIRFLPLPKVASLSIPSSIIKIRSESEPSKHSSWLKTLGSSAVLLTGLAWRLTNRTAPVESGTSNDDLAVRIDQLGKKITEQSSHEQGRPAGTVEIAQAPGSVSIGTPLNSRPSDQHNVEEVTKEKLPKSDINSRWICLHEYEEVLPELLENKPDLKKRDEIIAWNQAVFLAKLAQILNGLPKLPSNTVLQVMPLQANHPDLVGSNFASYLDSAERIMLREDMAANYVGNVGKVHNLFVQSLVNTLILKGVITTDEAALLRQKLESIDKLLIKVPKQDKPNKTIAQSNREKSARGSSKGQIASINSSGINKQRQVPRSFPRHRRV